MQTGPCFTYTGEDGGRKGEGKKKRFGTGEKLLSFLPVLFLRFLFDRLCTPGVPQKKKKVKAILGADKGIWCCRIGGFCGRPGERGVINAG